MSERMHVVGKKNAVKSRVSCICYDDYFKQV